MNISKYYWELNKKALRGTKSILRDTKHPQFCARAVTLLSRCDKPKEFFSIVPKQEFIQAWPKINEYWRRLEPKSTFRNWWQTVYEQLLVNKTKKLVRPSGDRAEPFLKIGRLIKEARVDKGFSQSAIALKVGMKQPDISKIEEGRKNITLATLFCLCKALEIKEIKLG